MLNVARITLLLLGALAAAPATQPSVIDLPSYGLAAPTPPGWIRMRENGNTTVVKWLKLDDAKTKSLGMLQIEIQAKSVGNLDAYAAAFAAGNHAKITNTTAKLGNLRTIEFTSDAAATPSTKIHLITGRLAEHAGYYYGVYLLAPNDKSGRDAFDAVSQDLQWTDIAPPADCLAPRDKTHPIAFALLDTPLVFDLPDPYRLIRDEQNHQRYITYDFAADTLQAVVDITRSPAHGDDLATIENSVAQTTSKEGWATPPAWTTPPDNPKVAYCGLVKRNPAQKGVNRGPAQIILVMVGNDSYAMLLFSYPTDDVAAKYAAVVPDIAKSFRTSSTYVVGHAKPEKPKDPGQ